MLLNNLFAVGLGAHRRARCLLASEDRSAEPAHNIRFHLSAITPCTGQTAALRGVNDFV